MNKRLLPNLTNSYSTQSNQPDGSYDYSVHAYQTHLLTTKPTLPTEPLTVPTHPPHITAPK